MAKGKNERRRRAKRPADSPPAKPPADSPPAKRPSESPPAEQPPAAAAAAPLVADDVADDAPESPASRRGTIVAVAVVVACAAATGLLLSGWTPGPGSPGGGAPAAAPVTQPAPAKKPPRKAVRKPKPRLTRKQELARARIRARNVSRDLFSNECGVCHTLAAAGTSGQAGPNLDKLRPTRARVLAAIRNGGRGSGLMSPNLVVGNDAARIAAFVAQSTHR
jgi:mono/diheme cytochrome c family protein